MGARLGKGRLSQWGQVIERLAQLANGRLLLPQMLFLQHVVVGVAHGAIMPRRRSRASRSVSARLCRYFPTRYQQMEIWEYGL